jgi:hypothetical protein
MMQREVHRQTNKLSDTEMNQEFTGESNRRWNFLAERCNILNNK